MLSLLFFAAYVCASPLQGLLQHRAPSGVPHYAVKYAPVAYLYSGEHYFPSDIGAQLTNTQPEVNFTVISDAPNLLTLDNLNDLNNYGNNSEYVYLTSKDNVTTNPPWLFGVTPNKGGKTVGAKSCAVIVNDHGSGLVDVFYFYFYAFNFGGIYFGFNIGNHVGDWEHTMVRFQDGTPQAIWYSQHSNGEAFTYDATEKYGNGSTRVSVILPSLYYVSNDTLSQSYTSPTALTQTMPLPGHTTTQLLM